MSESQRIALPTNQDFGLAEVTLLDDPASYPVAVPELPGRSDDELRQAAEDGDWDLYETHGVDQNPLTYRALWSRFKDAYHGGTVDEPGGFIKAVLAMQRSIPTAREYAATLARNGLIQPREVKDLPDEFSGALLTTDEGEDQARAHFKVWYLASAAVAEFKTAKLAADYASDRMRAAGGNEKARQRAAALLYQARGVEDGDLPALMDSLSGGVSLRRANRLQELGMPGSLVAQLGDAPRPDVLMPRFNSADKIAEDILNSTSLDTQIAARQFFGMGNVADLATTNAIVEKPFDDKSLAFSETAISHGLAGSRLVHFTPETDIPFVSVFRDEGLASELGIPEEMAALGALATFMMREPALTGPQNHLYPRSDHLGNHVVNMVTTDYRIWLDQRTAREHLKAKA